MIVRNGLIAASLILIWNVVVSAPAQGQGAVAETCTQLNSPVGLGVRLLEQCKGNASGFDTFDAYYRVAADLTPEQGFANQARFQRRSTQGQVLEGLLRAFSGAERATAVDMVLSIRQGSVQYPPRSLLTFRKTNNNEWTSYVRGDTRSFFHRLNGNEPFTVALTYTYSRNSSVDLNVGTALLQSAGLGSVITPSVSQIIGAANTVVTSIINSNDIESESGYEFTFSPALNRDVSARFQVVDPRSGHAIATIRLRLEGTRSLLADPREHASVHGTLPSGLVAVPTLNNLSRQIAIGQAQGWDLINGALASASFQNVPLGREPTRQDIENLCATTDAGLQSDYSLATFDRTLVRAALIELATRTVRDRINPFKLCFNAQERAVIRTHLNYDTETEPVVSPDLAPFRDFEGLIALGCHFSGREGDYCGSRSSTRTKIEAITADQITLGPLDGISSARIFQGLPDNRVVSRADFVERFGAQFTQFGELSGSSGSLRVRETAEGPWLLVVGEQGPTGKLSRLSIRRIP